MRILNLLILFSIVASSCSDRRETSYSPNEQRNVSINKIDRDSLEMIRVAVSTMISPKETFKYYEDLFQYLSKSIGYSVEFVQRKTYQEVNDLLAKKEVDLAFICSGAYVRGKESGEFEILAVPVCNGKPLYQAYIIANTASEIFDFEDLRGKSFAFTDPLSNTGKLYASNRVKQFHSTIDDFFSSTRYTYAHDVSIELVAKGLFDGASVDGLIFDYIRAKTPDKVKSIRIVEKSEYFGIPPVVVPVDLDPGKKDLIQSFLFDIHRDSIGRSILQSLQIDSFILGSDDDYNSIRGCINFIKDDTKN